MEIDLVFYAILAALGYVLLQSLFIMGVWIAAAGETEVMPDGKDKDSEMILYPLKKFLMQSETKTVYFSGDQFTNLINKIQMVLPEVNLNVIDEALFLNGERDNNTSFLNSLNSVLSQIDSQIKIRINNNAISFYKIYQEPRFSKYLRKPLIQCPMCMASFWSIFSYWIPVLCLFGFSFWYLYLGVINICCVSYCNFLLRKKL
ncbi:hypothetical protein [Dysgonomonas sp. HGC4]|uniref:hypothetical protein n=1 Tax=Dysgonomonas sp. HGC4 TaxID=1658009 RepID=UPI00067FAA81|nr:hypothetical protein [Dysgonomonas sp. HGC4]MBD8349498.1 hypothetical protein [Dysgonomonas sp. HGC4]